MRSSGDLLVMQGNAAKFPGPMNILMRCSPITPIMAMCHILTYRTSSASGSSTSSPLSWGRGARGEGQAASGGNVGYGQRDTADAVPYEQYTDQMARGKVVIARRVLTYFKTRWGAL